MNYESARIYLINQGLGGSVNSTESKDTFLQRLQQGKPPLPGQATTILSALRIVFDNLKGQEQLDRNLVHALYSLAVHSPQLLSRWRSMGKVAPPLLEDDLQRIAVGVESIFSDRWQL